MDVFYFIVLVGVLILVHELGHFAWAKFFGVRVLQFSLGFGPRIAAIKRGETEYVIAAIPLGGYVRMLGESPYDEVLPDQRQRAFANQPLWKRVIIVIAGPAMNLVLPLGLYFIVFLADTRLPPPVIGTVASGLPAEGHLRPGDRVLSIDGEDVHTFHDIRRVIEHKPLEPLRFRVKRGGHVVTERISPALVAADHPLDLHEEVGRIGISPHRQTSAVGVVSNGPSVETGGSLRTFDVIIAAKGRPVETWAELVESVRNTRNSIVPVTYLRPTTLSGGLGGLVDIAVYDPHVGTLPPGSMEPAPSEFSNGSNRGEDDAVLLDRGIESAELYVHDVRPDSGEYKAGVRRGDRLLRLDGRPVRGWEFLVTKLAREGGRSHLLEWRRDGQVMQGRFRLTREIGVSDDGQRIDRYRVGMRNWEIVQLSPPVSNPRPLRYALAESLRATGEVVELTVFSVVRLFQGKLTTKSIGGPLTILEVAGTAAREGAMNYLTLMAFISINLGLINLLPIPLLDGGHLVFFGAEIITRKPVSPRFRHYASIAGLSLLILLMVLAFKNDLERQWPHLFEQSAIMR